MPRYDYRCSQCGNQYEKREGFDAPPVQDCPRCSGMARRVLRAPAIVFKGSGWYVNDSRKGSESAASAKPASENGNGAKPESTDSASPEPAPATKSEKPEKVEKSTSSD